jgi:molybdopterin converting factor small subunit
MKQSQVELKETLQSHTNKMHETLKVQTQAVFAAIQNQNQKIEEELVNQKAYIDDHLKVQKEESSMRLQNVEDTLDKIDTSLSEHEKVLTETSSRLLNLENNRARDKTHNAEVNKTLDKFCEKFAEQKKTNQQFENELNKVQSCSKSIERNVPKSATQEISLYGKSLTILESSFHQKYPFHVNPPQYTSSFFTHHVIHIISPMQLACIPFYLF